MSTAAIRTLNLPEADAPSFADRLLAWHDQHGRKDLPWQQNINAYRVWVSEIMLQQTQVVSVIQYFQRFMARFPTLTDLANASTDEVLHHWSGLGYYARARNLHKTAQTVMQQYAGEFPHTLDEVVALPGIGRSTAAAILSIVHNQPEAILDGNVKRVLARRYCTDGWPGNTKVANTLWGHAQSLLPTHSYGQYTQAIMDLGATLCTRSHPQCESCPVAEGCKAFATDTVAQYPHSKPKKEKPVRPLRMWIVVDEQQRVFLQQRPSKGVWGGLWSFPEQAIDEDKNNWLNQQGLGAEQVTMQTLPSFRHTFSHYHLQIEPVVCQLSAQQILEKWSGKWYKASSDYLGLAAPVVQLIQQVQNEVAR